MVYVVTNPYVPYDYLFHRSAMESNLRNFQSVYHPHLSLTGVGNAIYLTAAGASPITALIGVIGVVLLGWRAVHMRNNIESAEVRRRATGLLLAIPALFVSGQFVLFAAGKPGEFARFMLMADLFLLVEAVAVIATFVRNPPMRAVCGTLLLLSAAIPSFFYERGFIRDCTTANSRLIAAERLHTIDPAASRPVVIFAEPAPYGMPPLDVLSRKLILLPAGSGPYDVGGAIPVRPTGGPPGNAWLGLWTGTPISWADKHFDVDSDDFE